MNYCQSCGKPIVQPRRGGRKRFCDGRCRAAWHRGRRGTAAAGTSGAGVGAAERTATLEWLYGRLRADVERLGVMIEGQRGVRLNPAVAELRRVTVELDRRTPDADDDQRAYDNDLARVLRAVD